MDFFVLIIFAAVVLGVHEAYYRCVFRPVRIKNRETARCEYRANPPVKRLESGYG